MRPQITSLCVAAVFLAACSSSNKQAAEPGAGGERAATSPSNIGDGMSEEAFKALHQLSTQEPPPRRGQMIDIAGSRAYLSMPEGATAPVPGVVVIHEWWGLNEHIMHWADRLAAEGYAALAVDLYGGNVARTPEEAMGYMKAVNDEQALGILKAALAYLAADPRIKAEKLGAIGWCFGGGWSLQLALGAPELDAAVIYYGRLVTDASVLAAIEARVLGIFGTRDQGIPLDQVDAFEAALKQAGVDHRIVRYDADHAFGNPSSERYDQKAAAAAWEEARRFLNETLR